MKCILMLELNNFFTSKCIKTFTLLSMQHSLFLFSFNSLSFCQPTIFCPMKENDDVFKILSAYKKLLNET